jgi:hypothetical protein
MNETINDIFKYNNLLTNYTLNNSTESTFKLAKNYSDGDKCIEISKICEKWMNSEIKNEL